MIDQAITKQTILTIMRKATRDIELALMQYGGEWMEDRDGGRYPTFHLMGYSTQARNKSLSGHDDVFGTKLVLEVFPNADPAQ